MTKKKKRVYIPSLDIFRRTKIFADICRFLRTQKTLLSGFSSYSVVLMEWRYLPICRRKACKRPFCLFAACLRLANLRGLCEYKQAQRKSLKSPKNRVYRRFFVNHPPGYRPTRYQAERLTPPFVVNFFCEKFYYYLYFSYLCILIVKYFHFIMILNFWFLFFIFLIFSELWLVSVVLYVVC